LDNPGSVEGLFNVDTSGQGISWIVSNGLIRDIEQEIKLTDRSGKFAESKLKIKNGLMPSYILLTSPLTLSPWIQRSPFTLSEVRAIQSLSVGPSELVECSLESKNPDNGLSSNAFTKVNFGQIKGYNSISSSTGTSAAVIQWLDSPTKIVEGTKIEIGASASGPNGKDANSDVTVLVGKVDQLTNKASSGSSGLTQASLDNLWATGGYIGVTSSETGASGSFATFLETLATVDLDNKIIVPAEYKGKIKAIAGQEATQTVDSAKGLTVLIRDIREKNGNKQEVASLSVDGSFAGLIKSCDNGKIIQDAVDRVEVNDIIGVLGGAQYPEDVRIYKDLTLLGLPNSQGQLPVAKSFTLTNNAKLGLEILPSLGITAPLIDVDAGSLVWDGYRLASEGGLINLAAATYNENLAGLKVVTKSVNIKGKGKDQTIIDGSGVAPVFTILGSTVNMDGLKIQNGLGSLGLLAGGINNIGGKLTLKDSEVSNNKGFDFGGGILTASTLTLDNAIISNNEAENGGGIFQADGTATITDSVISNNNANNGGAIFKLLGSTGVTNSILSNNKANNGNGGAICQLSGSTTIDGSTLSENNAIGSDLLGLLGNGGAIYQLAGETIVKGGSKLQANTATENGGGILQAAGSTTIINSNIGGDEAGKGNTAKSGGAIFKALGTTEITGSSLSNNKATDGNGGAIYQAFGSTTIDGSTLSQNNAIGADLLGLLGNGGAIYQLAGETIVKGGSKLEANTATENGGGILQAAGSTTIINSNIGGDEAGKGNTAKSGGAIFRALGTTEITGSLLSNNKATDGNGGAIYQAFGSTTIDGSTLSNNNAIGSDLLGLLGMGGAIYQLAGDTIVKGGSKLEANTATRSGGAIFQDAGKTEITGSFLSNNKATDGNGGAVYQDEGETKILGGSTLDGNTATKKGGAIYKDAGTTEITNSILSNNRATDGGAIYHDTILNAYATTITGSTISNNWAQGTGPSGNGGGLYQVGGKITIQGNSLIDNNHANGGALGGNGGGIYIGGGGTDISFSTISNNWAEGLTGNGGGNGGGICKASIGTMTIRGATINSNEAKDGALGGKGGGIYQFAGDTKIYDSVINSNRALAAGTATGGYGGGIYSENKYLYLYGSAETCKVLGNTATHKGTGLWSGSWYNGYGVYTPPLVYPTKDSGVSVQNP
jgi:predicted outer membrane repeat protein